MLNQAKATPRPWHTDGYIINADVLTKFGNFVILAMPPRDDMPEAQRESEANASLIVKAVNNHEALLSALKSAKRVLESGNLESQDAEETAYEIIEAIANAENK